MLSTNDPHVSTCVHYQRKFTLRTPTKEIDVLISFFWISCVRSLGAFIPKKFAQKFQRRRQHDNRLSAEQSHVNERRRQHDNRLSAEQSHANERPATNQGLVEPRPNFSRPAGESSQSHALDKQHTRKAGQTLHMRWSFMTIHRNNSTAGREKSSTKRHRRPTNGQPNTQHDFTERLNQLPNWCEL